MTVEIHFTGRLENGAPIEFDAVDVFDLDDEGRIVKLTSWYDSHAVRKTLRAALEPMVGPPPDSWSVPPERAARVRAGARGVAAAAAPPLAAGSARQRVLARRTSACSSTAGRPGIRATARR